MKRNIQRSQTTLESTGLPIIRCSCGYKILLIPSIDAMKRAIEAHVETHAMKIKNDAKAEEETERVRADLIKQVFDLAYRL